MLVFILSGGVRSRWEYSIRKSKVGSAMEVEMGWMEFSGGEELDEVTQPRRNSVKVEGFGMGCFSYRQKRTTDKWAAGMPTLGLPHDCFVDRGALLY